ncbi:hypothetical protein M1N19_02115 [Dehalococcoidia bacterium]|nr:hypothetical protein [Dehalococcoidia bacterium]
MATQLVRMRGKDGEEFYIEIDNERVAPAEALGPYAAGISMPKVEEFAQVAEFIANRVGEIAEKVRVLSKEAVPDKLTIAFAVGLEGKASALCLLESSAKANVQVTCEWSKPTT